MDKTVHKLLNQQINKEFYSAYLYLEFSNYFKSKGLDGFANWYMIQAQEERDHAMLFYTYLQNQNQTVTLESIDKPDPSISCHMDVLKAGLTHEEYVTGLINNIYSAAYDVKDFRTMQFLDWFVKEQGEEETKANDLISKMELFGFIKCICNMISCFYNNSIINKNIHYFISVIDSINNTSIFNKQHIYLHKSYYLI